MVTINIPEWIVAVTAIYGALTGTLAFLKDRPKIVVTSGVFLEVPGDSEERFYIFAYNSGRYPVGLKLAGLQAPRKDFVFIKPEPGTLPKMINPGEMAHIRGNLGDLQEKGYQEPYDTAYVVDYSGKKYLTRVPFFRKIKRFLWVRFGRKMEWQRESDLKKASSNKRDM